MLFIINRILYKKCYNSSSKTKIWNMMKMQRVTPEQGIRLARLGYDWPCMVYLGNILYPGHAIMYGGGNVCPAPLIAEALEWCRQDRELIGEVEIAEYSTETGTATYIFSTINVDIPVMHDVFNDRASAESALLDEFLTILEEESCTK